MNVFKLSVLVLTLTLAAKANALLIQVTPSNQTVFLGDVAIFDVVATGLGTDLIGAYDATLSWDATLLSFLGVTFDTFLDGPSDAIQGSSSGVGTANVFEVSLGPLSFQNGADFRLFSLVFDTLGVGVSPVNFDSLVVSDASGRALEPASSSGSIEIVATTEVPEPPGLALFFVAAFALVVVQRERYCRASCIAL